MEARRQAAQARGETFKYDKHCLHLTPGEIQAKLDAGIPYVIRQNVPTTGTTSFSDMYFFPWEAAELVAVCGIKTNLCYPVQAFDPAEPYEKNESARKLERFYKDWHNAAEGHIRVDGCLHAEYTCNPHVAAGTAAWCRQNGVRMHIHLSETKSEHDTCIEKYGKTPAQWMNDLGVFDVPCAAAHCVWVTAEDRALLREKNPTATIVTTPWDELDGKQLLAAMERRDTLSAALEELAEDEEIPEDVKTEYKGLIESMMGAISYTVGEAAEATEGSASGYTVPVTVKPLEQFRRYQTALPYYRNVVREGICYEGT